MEENCQPATTTTTTTVALLKPFQVDIKSQLQNLKIQLSGQVKTLRTSLNAAATQRALLGDKLYQLQGSFDSLTRDIAQEAVEFDAKSQEISELQALLDALRASHEEAIAATATKRARIAKLQLGLSKLTSILHYFIKNDENSSHHLAAIKRGAYVAQDSRHRAAEANTHVARHIQVLRDNLDRVMQQTSIELLLAHSHQCAQQAAGEDARAVDEAAHQARSTTARVQRQWNSVLRDIQRLDAVISTGSRELESIRDKTPEGTQVVEKARREAMEQAQRNWELGEKIHKNIRSYEKCKKTVEALHQRVEAATRAKAASLESTRPLEQELVSSQQRLKCIERETEELENKRLKVGAEIVEVQKAIEGSVSQRSTTSAGVLATLQEYKSIQQTIFDKNNALQCIRQEIERLSEKEKSSTVALEALTRELSSAEQAVGLAREGLNAVQLEVDARIKDIEDRTRQLQALDQIKATVDDGSQTKDAMLAFQAEIDRLHEDIRFKCKEISNLHQEWSSAQDELLAVAQKLSTARNDAANAHCHIDHNASKHTALEKSISSAHLESKQLSASLKHLKKQLSSLDEGQAQLAMARALEEEEINTEQSTVQDEIDTLKAACAAKEARIIVTLQQQQQATAQRQEEDSRLEHSLKERNSLSAARQEEYKLRLGKCNEAVQLQGQVASLQRRLSSAQQRREKTAIRLKNAVKASGIDNGRVFARALSTTEAELAAAKERLAQQRAERREDIARRAAQSS